MGFELDVFREDLRKLGLALLIASEVLARWTTLFSGPLLVQRYLEEGRGNLSKGDVLAVDQLAEQYRERLMDLSWFMRTLNEAIARWANAEEGVKGRFWKGGLRARPCWTRPL